MATLTTSILGMIGTVGASIFAAVSSSAASKSVMVAEKQIKQNKENFRKQSRPVLHIATTELEYNTPFKQQSINHSSINNFYSHFSDLFSLKIVNLGESSARNIKIITKVDNFNEFFSKYNPRILDVFNDDFGYLIKKEKNYKSEVEFHEALYFESDSSAGYIDNQFFEQDIDFLTPLAEEEKNIKLPKLFTILHELMVYHVLCGEFFITPIILDVNIEYEDYIGNKWRQNFKVKSKIVTTVFHEEANRVLVSINSSEIDNFEIN